MTVVGPPPAVLGSPLPRQKISPRTILTVVLIVVAVVVAGVGFFVLPSLERSPSSPSACCGSNDVELFVPILPRTGQVTPHLGEGAPLQVSAALGGGENASNFTVNWGDGTTATQPTSVFSHSYASLGEYVVSATAMVGASVHTGTLYLVPIIVNSTLFVTTIREFPTVAASITNGSPAPSNYYPWTYPGHNISVFANYTGLPNLPGYVARPPTIIGSAGTVRISGSSNTTSATATYSFATAGIYQLTMVGPISTPHGIVYQNYTWTVYVGKSGYPLGCTSACHSVLVPPPSHPGIFAYEIAPNGATSLDPAVDYEPSGGEVLQNVFETLVNYNGSSTDTFTPVLSSCIPGPTASGPTSCQTQFGSGLNAGPNGTYWTLPIDPNASFYDPSTGAHWAVYPSDVMFSVARTLMWLENPSEYSTNGWIIGQSLLPFGNSHWDAGLHAPWNNTPQTVLTSMLVNDSAYCPAKALAQAGCITFKADGSGQNWPFFLELVQDSEGASVVPCGWYTAQGAGLPGFITNTPRGDGPCLLPGGVTTTNTSGFHRYVNSASPTLYDNIVTLDTINYQNPYPQVRWNIVGSGPYWLEKVNNSQGYILKANPYYAQPNCASQPGCYAPPGQSPRTVYVFWDPNDTVGLEQYFAGQADFAQFYPTDLPTMINLESEAKVTLFEQPTLDLFPESFSMRFNATAAEMESTLPVNVPGDFFSYPGMRMFLAATFPYASYIDPDNAVDGVPFIQGEGGAIPEYLGDYYPENITWPGMNASTAEWPQLWVDPNTNATIAPSLSSVGSPLWWWTNITDPRSPYYDSEAAACSSATPCKFTINSEAGALDFDMAVDQWDSTIRTVTGGALVPQRWDPVSPVVQPYLGVAPGTSPFDTWATGWLPDYPDPTDYVAPFWLPDGSYDYAGAYNETLQNGSFGGLCGGPGALGFADFAFWANYAAPLVPTACQGTAYHVMVWAADSAAVLPVGPQRILYYNMIEHIANKLVLDVYDDQQVDVGSCAIWVNPAGIDTNVMAPGQLWFNWSWVDS